MRKILLVCAALACMTVSPVPAQDAAVKKIIEMGQNDNQVMHSWISLRTALADV